MKMFQRAELTQAYEHAMEGGQALHVWQPVSPGTWPGAPSVFKRHSEWAHLFDQDAVRLEKTARQLGVRVVKIERSGTPKQHVDLCGKPLEKAKALCLTSERFK